jgi:DNA-binding HxlR family transcriptional regulator
MANGDWIFKQEDVIIAISPGQSKFKDIERQIPKLIPRMLWKELKSLGEHQLIKRVVYDTVPVTIEYKLTSHPKTLDKVILELRNWECCIGKKINGKS